MIKEEEEEEKRYDLEERATLFTGFGGRFATTVGLFVLVLANGTNEIVESLFNVDTGFGGSFLEGGTESARKVLAFLVGNFAFVFQIALVAYQHHWQRICVFDTHHLFLERRHLFERRPACDRVYYDEAFTVSNPLIAQRCELFLACCVQNLQQTRFVIYHHLLPV